MNETSKALVVAGDPASACAISVLFRRPRLSLLTAPGLTNVLLMVIALSLLAIVLWPILHPLPVAAESHPERRLFIEPGVQMLHTSDLSRNVYGRVVIDLRSGNVWGFPTPTGDPYPLKSTNDASGTSHPFLLGRFALEDMDK